jgi:hypothetical protein
MAEYRGFEDVPFACKAEVVPGGTMRCGYAVIGDGEAVKVTTQLAVLVGSALEVAVSVYGPPVVVACIPAVLGSWPTRIVGPVGLTAHVTA